MILIRWTIFVWISLGLTIASEVHAATTSGSRINGVVVDSAGAAIPGATIRLRNTSAVDVRSAATDGAGAFGLTELSPASYALTVVAPGFETHEIEVVVGDTDPLLVRIELNVAILSSTVTVTAGRGTVADVAESPRVATVRDRTYMLERPLTTLGSALEASPGILIQQTTYGQASPILRGLTGYHVLNLIDGIRFNNSIFRSGPNQYLSFIEPGQVRRIEAVLGPAGSLYGSDSLGGTINTLTASAPFGVGAGLEKHGELYLSGGSADLSGVGSAEFSLSNRRFALILGSSGRRINDLRSGGGEDSRNVFRRFFDLESDQIQDLTGDRLQDTGFSQYGFHSKLSVEPSTDQRLTVSYQAGSLDNVRQYRNLFGGRGRLQSAFDPQRLQFVYARYERMSLGILDSLSATFSVNSQRDGNTRQNERVTDRIVSERNDVDVFGYSGQARTHSNGNHVLVFGGEIYNEHIRASRFDTDPTNGRVRQRRALYPNGSRYTTYGLFVEDTAFLLDGKIRVMLGGRFTNVRAKTFADRDSFGVIDSSQSFSDVSFNSALTWNVSEPWRLHVLVGRGFRAPNLNDLGAVGLNSLGFEIPASASIPFGALIGSSAGEDAASTGKKVERLSPERLYSFETGLTYDGDRVYGRIQAFDSEIYNPIVRRTLLFPEAHIPSSLGGVNLIPNDPTDEQRAAGVVPLGADIDPLALKAFVNDGRVRYYGFESQIRFRPTPGWTLESNYSFLVGRDLNPNRNVRRLVPQNGSFTLRYTPGSKPFWLEFASRFSGEALQGRTYFRGRTDL